MTNILTVQRKREIGELLTDPFKFIFRNLKAITVFLLPYIMLPFIVAFVFMTQFQMDILSEATQFDTPGNLIKIAIMILGLIIATLHAPLASVCIIKSAIEDGGHDIQHETLTQNFSKLYWRNVKWIITSALIVGIPSFLFVFLVVSAPVIGVILFLIFLLAAFLYLVPLLLYAYFSFLLNSDLTLTDSFAKGKEILDNYWGISIGMIFLSGIVSNMLQYMIMIPYLILIMVLGTAFDFGTDSSLYAGVMTIQNVIYGFALCYLLLYSTIVYLLKYYDIQEQENGTNMLKQITAIGAQENSYFDNEGSY